MSFQTQAERFYGGALFVSDAMGQITLHPWLARVYIVAPNTPRSLNLPTNRKFDGTGPMFYVFNEGPSTVTLEDPQTLTTFVTIPAAKVAIVIRTSDGVTSFPVSGGGVWTPQAAFRAILRPSF